jgi:DNA-binding NarL/FixJ family response regulator
VRSARRTAACADAASAAALSPRAACASPSRVSARASSGRAAPPPQLVAAIRTVHAGDGVLASASTRWLIEQSGRPPAPAPALGTLTACEHDVLRLLARDLTNAEIAAEPVVEPSTVKPHVASLLAKLNLRDRVQAVVFAYESGLVHPGTG